MRGASPNATAGAHAAEFEQAPDSLTRALDSIADRIRPEWELTPHSKRVSSADADPEVVVHYPAHWQPPPSERRRLHEQPKNPSSVPVNRGASSPPADALDAGWAAEDRNQPVVPDSPGIEAESLSDPDEAVFPAIRLARVVRERQGPPGHASSGNEKLLLDERSSPIARVSDSTAPASLTQPPCAKEAGSRGGLWAAAGLAALALAGVVWRNQTPAAPPAARAHAAPDRNHTRAPAAVAEASPAEPSEPSVDREREAKSANAERAPVPLDASSTPELLEPEVQAPSQALQQSRSSEESSEPTRERAQAQVSHAEVEPSGAEPAPSAPLAEFDAEHVRAVLAAAAARANECNGDTAGAGTVRVLLNPAGGVLNATVTSGPFQGTAIGNCVERTFESTTTAPYRGRSLSTVVPFSLPGKP